MQDRFSYIFPQRKNQKQRNERNDTCPHHEKINYQINGSKWTKTLWSTISEFENISNWTSRRSTAKVTHLPRLHLWKNVNSLRCSEEGYPRDYLSALKKEETKVRNIFLGVMSGVAIATLGYLAIQHKKNHWFIQDVVKWCYNESEIKISPANGWQLDATTFFPIAKRVRNKLIFSLLLTTLEFEDPLDNLALLMMQTCIEIHIMRTKFNFFFCHRI